MSNAISRFRNKNELSKCMYVRAYLPIDGTEKKTWRYEVRRVI